MLRIRLLGLVVKSLVRVLLIEVVHVVGDTLLDPDHRLVCMPIDFFLPVFAPPIVVETVALSVH